MIFYYVSFAVLLLFFSTVLVRPEISVVSVIPCMTLTWRMAVLLVFFSSSIIVIRLIVFHIFYLS